MNATLSVPVSVPTVAASGVASSLPRQPRYRALDLWRGLACLMVVGFHSLDDYAVPSDSLAAPLLALAHKGWLGVPIFFVISGYCIAATADSRRSEGVIAFFRRRFRRIYPPCWIAVLTIAALTGAVEVLRPGLLTGLSHPLPRPWWFSGWQWLGSLTLTESWRYHVVGGPRGYVVGVLWTLCYEEQFYALTGLLLLACGRRYFFRGVSLLSLAVLAIAPAVFCRGFFCDGLWHLFAAGVLVYWTTNYAGRRGAALAYLLLAVGMLVGGTGWPLPLAPWTEQAPWHLTCGFGFALVLLVLRRWDDRLVSLRGSRPLLWCGTLCYSLYLVHAPLVQLVNSLLHMEARGPAFALLISLPLCLAVSLAAAWGFHVLVEKRAMSSRSAAVRNRSSVYSRLAAAYCRLATAYHLRASSSGRQGVAYCSPAGAWRLPTGCGRLALAYGRLALAYGMLLTRQHVRVEQRQGRVTGR